MSKLEWFSLWTDDGTIVAPTDEDVLSGLTQDKILEPNEPEGLEPETFDPDEEVYYIYPPHSKWNDNDTYYAEYFITNWDRITIVETEGNLTLEDVKARCEEFEKGREKSIVYNKIRARRQKISQLNKEIEDLEKEIEDLEKMEIYQGGY